MDPTKLERAKRSPIDLDKSKLKIYYHNPDGSVSVLRYRKYRSGGKVRHVLVGNISLTKPKPRS